MSSSSGLTVWLFTIMTPIFSFSNSLAAKRALWTSGPQAIMATSGFLPAQKTSAFPGVYGVASVVNTGVFSLANRIYTGPHSLAAASVAFLASLASHGENTRMLGMARMIAMSSVA